MATARFLMVLSILLGLSIRLQAQKSDEEVRTSIEQLFLAMQTGDSTLARSVFTENVTAATVSRDKTAKLKFEQEKGIDDFIKAIGSPHPKAWYEEIWGLKIEIDGDFAQAWCDYAFYLDSTFSHCGVDAFHLVKTDTGWKIFHLSDTRRKTNCDIPAEIREKHR